MNVSYLCLLFFLGNSWVSVKTILIDSEGVNTDTPKEEVKTENNGTELEKKEYKTFRSSISGKDEDVLGKPSISTDNSNNQDSKNDDESVFGDIEDSKRVKEDVKGKEAEDSITNLKDGSLTIDISKDIESNLCVVQKLDLNNIPTKLYIPRAGYRINKLVCGSDVIWESIEDEYCFMVDITMCKDDTPCMIMISTKGEGNDYKYFERKGTKWQEVASVWYYLKLVDKIKFKNNNNPFDVDIKNKKLNGDCYTFLDCEIDYVHTNFYFAKTGNKINMVKDGDHVLYSGNGIFESYPNVRVILFKGEPILVKIEGMLSGITKTYKYQMVKDSWKVIDDSNYDDVVQRLRDYKRLNMNSNPGVFELNLSNVDLKHFEILDKSEIEKCYSRVKYSTKKGSKLSYIFCDGELVWSSLDDGVEASVIVTYLIEKPILIQVDIYGDERDTVYYDYAPGYWNRIDKDEYMERIGTIYTS